MNNNINITQVVNYILYCNLPSELEQVRDAYNTAKAIHTERHKSMMRVGQKVSFTSKGETIVGVIQKIMQKNIRVLSGSYTGNDRVEWKVSPNLLTIEEENQQ